MNKELAHEFRLLLQGLPFISLCAGMAQVQEMEDVGDGKTIIKHFPVSYDTNKIQCENESIEISLVPNSSEKGILYFEDGGILPGKKVNGGIEFKSTLVLVCFLNRELLVNNTYEEITAKCIVAIMENIITNNPINLGIFKKLSVNATSILQQNKSLFAAYTYNEAVKQYLRPPYEYFGIKLNCEYQIPFSCANDLDLIENPPCIPEEIGCINGIVTEDNLCISLENDNNNFLNIE